MEDITSKLKSLAKELSKKDNVKPPTVFWNKSVSPGLVQKIQTSLGFEIPEEILDIYRIFDGLVIDWEIRMPEEPWRTGIGRSNIPRLEFLFRHEQIMAYKNKKSQLDHYWPDDVDKEKVEHYKKFYILDFLKTGESILFIPRDYTDKPALYYFRFPDEFAELALNFKAYIYHLLEAKAAYGWQLGFLKEDRAFDSTENLFPTIKKGTNYFTLLSDRVESIKKNRKFKKVVFVPNPGVKVSTLNRIQKSMGMRLPVQMLQFYYFVNGFKLSWSWQDEDCHLQGSVDLLPLEIVFGGPGAELTKSWESETVEDTLWKLSNGNENPKLISELTYVKRIESIEGVSREVMVSFAANTDTQDLTVFLLEKGSPLPLNIDFLEYISLLMDNLGLAGWHKALIVKNKEFIKYLSAVFPEANVSSYLSIR